MRVAGVDNIPRDSPYLLNFSHPSWMDPLLLVAFWPEPPMVYVFGPKEEDMSTPAQAKECQKQTPGRRWSSMPSRRVSSSADRSSVRGVRRGALSVTGCGRVASVIRVPY